MKAEVDYDLIVIGGGPAGEKGAARAAYFGKKVALVEMTPVLGGASAPVGIGIKAGASAGAGISIGAGAGISGLSRLSATEGAFAGLRVSARAGASSRFSPRPSDYLPRIRTRPAQHGTTISCARSAIFGVSSKPQTDPIATTGH